LKIVLKNWKGVFKMEKVKINQEQADKIRGWEYHTGYPGRLLELRAQYLLTSSKCLQSLSLDKLARALYVGYEVEVEELEPQFEVEDWVIHDGGIAFKLSEFQLANLGKSNGLRNYRHATESEIAAEKKRRMDKKIDEIILDLSDEERDRLYEKLFRGDY